MLVWDDIQRKGLHSNSKSDSQSMSGCEINFTPRCTTASTVRFCVCVWVCVHVSNENKTVFVVAPLAPWFYIQYVCPWQRPATTAWGCFCSSDFCCIFCCVLSEQVFVPCYLNIVKRVFAWFVTMLERNKIFWYKVASVVHRRQYISLFLQLNAFAFVRKHSQSRF